MKQKKELLEGVMEMLKERFTPEDKWNTHNKLNDVTFYFSTKNADVKDYIVVKYAEIEVVSYGSDMSGEIKNIEPWDNFNYEQWILAIKENILDAEVKHTKNDFITDRQSGIIETEKIVEVIVENTEHKVKADILDNLLLTKNLTN